MNLIFSDFRKIFSFPSSTLPPPYPTPYYPKIFTLRVHLFHTPLPLSPKLLTQIPNLTHPTPTPFPHPPIKKQSMLFIPFFKCMVIIAPKNCDLSSIFCTTAQAVPFKDTLVPLYVLFYYFFPFTCIDPYIRIIYSATLIPIVYTHI